VTAVRRAQDEPLVGDDFDAAGLLEWYEDEKNGYFSLYGSEATGDGYPYHHVNGRTRPATAAETRR
jgi:hypothetical protein